MANTRHESDFLGKTELPADALYGIHTARAIINFPIAQRPVHTALIRAYGLVKLACLQTANQLGQLKQSPENVAAIEQACHEMSQGKLVEHILVDALQGGAGTSLNMNINEVIANRALEILDKSPGDYTLISPLDDINLFQSTNDTFPTALKVAAIWQINLLETQLVKLQESFQKAEQKLADVVKIARTQLQDAVLTTLGREMSAYAEAFNRDRWRVSKCVERLRVVNLGGTAIGSGLSAPKQYIFRATDNLRALTGLGLARAENLIDATQNCDEFVEVSGILKACASSLIKVCNDLRFLSSGPEAGIGEITLPPRQAGSSIMPGKSNPVIPEAVIQAAMSVMGNDLKITQAASNGSLELNPFLPLIADALLNSIDLLTNSCRILSEFCINDLQGNPEKCELHVNTSTATLTALIHKIGYEKASDIAAEASATREDIKTLIIRKKLMSEEDFDALVSPESVCRLGN